MGLGPTTRGMVTTRTEAYDPLRYVPIAQTDFLDTPMHAVYRSMWDRGLVEGRDDDAEAVLALGGAYPKELEGCMPEPSDLEDDGFRAMLWDMTMGEMRGAFPDGIWELCQRDTDLGRARDGASGAADGDTVPIGVDTLSEMNDRLVKLTNGAKDALDERNRALDELSAAKRELDELRRATDARIALLTDAAASARSAAEAARSEADSYREAAEGAEEAVGRAEATLADARAREEQAEKTLSEVDRALSERDDEIRRLRSLLAASAPSGEGAAAPEARPMAVSEMDAVPRTLGQVLDLAERAWPDRLEVLPSAHESAERWEGRDVDRPWRALRAVAEVLWPMHFEEKVPEEYRAFADATGFSLAMQESDTVCQSQRLRDARTFLRNGRRVFMPAHIAVTGGRTDTSIRMHLAFDEGERKVVIGHLGRHLPNTKS